MSKIRLINREYGELEVDGVGYYAIGENLYDAIEQLQKENEELKEQNESLKKYYEYDNKSWKNLAIKQAHDLEIKNNILTEFEKWLWEKLNIKPANKIYASECLEKLKEIKESVRK